MSGDEAALRRAVGNLVENARRHGRGTVTLTVARTTGGAELSVEDEGRGIPDGDRERVFERFHGDGTGLGLAIVRATTERHGGTATVDGSRFAISLPLRKPSETGGQPSGDSLEKGTP